MNSMNYACLDIHKKSISCCVRQADGTIIQESTITATRPRTGRVDAAAATTMDGRHGGNAVYRVDLRLSGIRRRHGEGGASGHAAGDRIRKEEERSGGCLGRSLTYCAATTSQNATWHRARFGTAGGCCATAILLVRQGGANEEQS